MQHQSWRPLLLTGLWLPVKKSDEGYVSNSFDGFHDLVACQQECDRRNRLILGEAEATIERLEREMETVRSAAHDAEAALNEVRCDGLVA